MHNQLHFRGCTLVMFSPTCNEPAEVEEVHDTQSCWGHNARLSTLPCARKVSQNQREDARYTQHDQVNGNVGLHWTIVQLCTT